MNKRSIATVSLSGALDEKLRAIASAGFESVLKSGTSLPTHRPVASFHHTCGRSGSHGLPDRSHDARLYCTRRFAGHDHAQFGYTPRPDGSSVSRRAV